ncbi:MAG TPA: hypothetical protein VLB09_07255 [Nitrospiria bacterium]|nr:hypothetical protein [Nitrospiria bacterium]
MKEKKGIWTLVAAVLLALPGLPPAAMAKDQAGIVAAEISTIAKHLSVRPETAIDLTGVSGAYCFNTGLGSGGHMTHYAVDPEKTKEDVIDFVNAASLEASGINVKDLPKFPGKLGTMEPNTWYYLPAGEHEPHHGMVFSFPLMIRATNLE